MDRNTLLQIGLTEAQTDQVLALHTEVSNAKDKYLEEFKKDTKTDEMLVKFGVKNAKAVKALLDLNNVSLDGENLIGLSEQLNIIKATDPYLFETRGLAGREPQTGNGYHTAMNEQMSNPFKKETWNLTKQSQLFNESPELYDKLKRSAGL